jgi:Na+/H+-translocating membrane pyrophosphatase
VGGSLAALFGQIGRWHLHQSADVGADLVGKVEEKIPEDDPRNAAGHRRPGGRQCGRLCRARADLFPTFSDDIITGSVVCATLVSIYGSRGHLSSHPVTVCGHLSSSIIGILATRQCHRSKPTASQCRVMDQCRAQLRWGDGPFLLLIDDITIGPGCHPGCGNHVVTAATTRH